jgi:hypothetical protein
MKPFLLSIFIFILCIPHCNAQLKKDSFHLKKMPFIFFENGVGRSHFNFGITVSLKNSWGLNFNQKVFEYRPENYPLDYKTGLCLFGNCEPKDKKNISTIQIQKMLFTKFSEVRYSFAAGFGELTHAKLIFTPAPRPSGWFNFSSNYNISDEKRYVTGFIASSSIEFPIAQIVGFKATTFVFVTNIKSYSKAGVELNFVYGYVRERLGKKIKTK